ncbi:hypothetical protein BGZ59_010246 [Podila verticillata]|nr:hypothetical protein BGZ59_010246 [Podila verticillata]
MTPTPPPAAPKPATTADESTTAAASSDAASTSSTSARSSWSTWGAASSSSWGSSSAWGASLNKFIERGKKDMNEFVDVTRKDLNELVQTVQAESSTTVASLSKKVEDLKKSTTLPASVSAVVEGIKQGITEAATGVSSAQQKDKDGEAGEDKEDNKDKEGEARKSMSQDTTTANKTEENKGAMPEGEAIVGDASTSSTTATTAPQTRAEKTTSSGLSFANTASLLTAGASTLTHTLTASTKDIGTSANQLFKKTLPAVAEKHLGEADQFLKSTTETLKSNGLIAEQYVNKFGAGMANFINSAVVISAPPEEKEQTGRSKKMFFDRKAAMLEQLRLDPATYTVDPMTTIADNDIVGLERYKYFLQTFNMAEYQQRITRLLNEYPEVKALMHKLVPIDVADEELFWLRYHFRLFEIEEEEKRRKKLVQEVGNDLAEDEFTWDDDEEEESDTTNKHHGQQHGSATPKAASDTPKAGQVLGSTSTLTPEALASSLSALPVPSSDKINRADSGSEDEWGTESPKAAPVSSANLAVAKSPTNMSSTRTSEDSYAVVDGAETPLRGSAAVNSVQSMSSAASSPRVEQPAQQGQASKKEAKEEDDWSDWE